MIEKFVTEKITIIMKIHYKNLKFLDNFKLYFQSNKYNVK